MRWPNVSDGIHGTIANTTPSSAAPARQSRREIQNQRHAMRAGIVAHQIAGVPSPMISFEQPLGAVQPRTPDFGAE